MIVFEWKWTSAMRRLAAASIAVLAVAALAVAAAPTAPASHMEAQSLSVDTNGPSASASYDFEWRHGVGNAPAPAGSSYVFTFPAGFDVSGAALGSGSTLAGAAFTATVSVSGQAVTLADVSAGVVQGNQIAVVLDGIVNRTAAGSAAIAVQMLTPTSAVSSSGSFAATIANGPVASIEVTDPSGGPLGPQSAGQPFDVRVRALDEFGNLVNGTGGGPSFVGTVDLTSSARGSAGLGTTAAFAGGQVVQSVTLTEATDGAALTATVSGGSLSGAAEPFEVAPGPAHHLSVVQSPSGARSGEVLTPALVVEVRDEFGNVVTAATGPVRVALVGAGAQLSGTVEVDAVRGVATFDDLVLTGAGEGLSLQFTYVPGGLTAADTADTTTFALAAEPAPPAAAPPVAAPRVPTVPPASPPLGTAGAPAAGGPSGLALTGPASSAPIASMGVALLLAGVLLLRRSRHLTPSSQQG